MLTSSIVGISESRHRPSGRERHTPPDKSVWRPGRRVDVEKGTVVRRAARLRALEAGGHRVQPIKIDRWPAAAGHGQLAAGLFGPGRKVHAVANWSSVEPGSAVRVVARMSDPDGNLLTTDLTAFGSQSWYRLGCISRQDSRYKLFTSVAQHGARLTVTAGLDKSFRAIVSGSIELGSGETGTITLPNGLKVTVTPYLRPETPQESADDRRAFVGILRVPAEA